MAAFKNISVKVCGNPQATGGFMPIATFNSPNFQILDVVYGGFHMNSYFFSIKIEPTQVIYKIIKNNVRSAGSIRQGSLVIAMSIPKGYKLNGNVTPYDVLKKLLETFLASCMTCKDAATDAYEYINGIIKPTIMDEVASKYQLVPYVGPHRTMRTDIANVGYVVADEAKIRQLMNDVQYPAFANFSEVLVANTSSSNYTHITNVEIPRVSEYRIIDGIKNDAIVRNPNESIVRVGQKDERYYLNGSVSFTLGALLRGDTVPNVKLDTENETIIVDTNRLSTPIERHIRVVISPSNISARDIIISTDTANIELNTDSTFTLRGEQIRLLEGNNSIRPLYRGRESYSITKHELRGNEFDITLKQNLSSSTSGKTGYGTAAVSNINANELLISLSGGISDKKRQINIINGEKVVYRLYDGNPDTQEPRLQGEDSLLVNRATGRYECSFYIPKKWTRDLILKITVQGHTFKSNVEASDNRLIAQKFKPSSIRNPKADSILARYLILFIVGALVGGVGGFMLKNRQIEKAKAACTICNYVAPDTGILRIHMQRAHPKCEKCGKQCTSQDELNKHMRDEHEFKCPICNKVYDTKEERDKCQKSCQQKSAVSGQKSIASPSARTDTRTDTRTTTRTTTPPNQVNADDER